MKAPKVVGLLIGLLAPWSSHAQPCAADAQFSAQYKVYWGNVRLGEGAITQTRRESLDGRNCLLLIQTAEPRGLLKWTVGNLRESSYFCLDELGAVIPARYDYQVEDSPDKSYSLRFLDRGHRIEGGRFGQITTDQPTIDPLSLQAELRSWVCGLAAESERPQEHQITLPVVRRGGIASYRFGATQINDEADSTSGRKLWLVQRLDSAKRQLRFWLDPARNMLVVRAEHNENGSRPIRMELTTHNP